MTLLLASADIRAIEQRELAQGAQLMERAGLAAANAARAMLERCANHPARVLVLTGPGNNGGDGFEAAAHLARWEFDVTVLFASAADKLPADARTAHAKWMQASSAFPNSTHRTITDLPTLAPSTFDLVIDALFGIGLARPISAPYAGWIEAANRSRIPILSLDVPSGLDADTGGAAGPTVHATRTLTFIADKPGLHTLNGPDHAGEIMLARLDLRFPLPAGAGHLVGLDDCAPLLKRRQRNSHKGTYGAVGVFGGSQGMAGAALLAARAALLLGAGKVFVGLLDPDAMCVDALHPELMFRSADELCSLPLAAAVVGPGLGTAPEAATLLAKLIDRPISLVLDADALNLIGDNKNLQAAVAQRKAPTLMTPHPLEAARLLACPVAEVQADRIQAARELARRYHAHIVLKGAGSIVANPEGAWWINPTGNPGMASGGMGDVLAGMAGALLAQHALSKNTETVVAQGFPADAPASHAATILRSAVYLHGAAADSLVARNIGPVGLTASEVAVEARRLWNAWQGSLPPA
jgi:ADP-dependent NAD(P)H-hydrate dehydratase / NAD(P)H-hydrate epimerase